MAAVDDAASDYDDAHASELASYADAVKAYTFAAIASQSGYDGAASWLRELAESFCRQVHSARVERVNQEELPF